MSIDNWQYIASVAFFVGMAAGLLLSVVISVLFYRLGLFAGLGDHAAHLAESARLHAEIALQQQQRHDLEACLERDLQLINAAVDPRHGEQKAVQL